MKKWFSKLALVLAVVALCVTFAGCSVLTIYVPSVDPDKEEIGSSSATVTEIVTDVMKTDSYGKTYAVKNVDLNCAEEKGEEQSKIAVTEAVYNSNVTIKSLVSNEPKYGSGTIIDINVEYENEEYNTLPFLYILTCHHVISDSNQIVVYIASDNAQTEEVGDCDYYGIALGATLMGSDKTSDIAILRIEVNDKYENFNTKNYTDKIYKAQIGAYNLSRGEDIFAIGCPTGSLPGSVSYGNVSNLYVNVNVSDIGEMVLHQTDTATNKGNSGGGIYNYAGQLVGVLNAGATDYDGISFFIPVTGKSGVKTIAIQLISNVTDNNYGYVEGRWNLGASFVQEQSGGMYIKDIVAGSTLDNENLKEGSYIFEMCYTVGGEKKSCSLTTLTAFDTFYKQMQKDLEIGDTITVTYGVVLKHGGKYVYGTVDLTVKQYVYSPKN